MNSPRVIGSSKMLTIEQFEGLAMSPDVDTRLAAARNPLAPPQLLEKLSHDSEKSIRQAVAGNPNTPEKDLMRLGAQFPDELLENPALDVLLLENPSLLSALPEKTQTSIAKRDTCPPSVLGHLVEVGRGKGLLMSLIQNGGTPHEAIRKLIDEDIGSLAEKFEVTIESIRKVKNLASHHVSIRGEVTLEDARSALWRGVTDRLRGETSIGDLLSCSGLPARHKDDVTALASLQHGKSSARCAVTRPASVLEAIACGSDKRGLKALQSEENCPDWLRAAKSSEDASRAIEASRAASEILWDEATASGSNLMLLALADHPFANGRVDASSVLHRLAQALSANRWQTVDGDVLTSDIWMLASHYKTAPRTLEFFYDQVRRNDQLALPDSLNALEGQNLQQALMDWLKSSRRKPEQLISVAGLFWATDQIIRDHGRAPFGLIADLEAAFHVRAAIASNPRTPYHVLRALAEYGVPEVALNPSASEDVLNRVYSVNPHWLTTSNIAAHPAAPIKILIEVSKLRDQDCQYARALSMNPSSSEEVLLEIATMKSSCSRWTPADTVSALLKHPNLSGRVLDVAIAACRLGDLTHFASVLASDLRLSAGSYERLMKLGRSSGVRRPLAENPVAPTDVLNQLSMDADDSVRKAAVRTLEQRQAGGA